MFRWIIISVILFCTLGDNETIAQTEPGVYITAGDFANDHLLSFGKKSHLIAHDLFNRDIISLVCRDSSRDFHKNEIFAYKNTEGEIFRIYKGDEFKILNPREKILLYRQSNGTGLKGSPIFDYYFFSRDAGTGIEPLTLSKLLEAFEGDLRFDLVLELYFKSDEELVAYDAFHKMYKINRLLQVSQELVITH